MSLRCGESLSSGTGTYGVRKRRTVFLFQSGMKTYGMAPILKNANQSLLDVIAFGNLFGKVLFLDLLLKILGMLTRESLG